MLHRIVKLVIGISIFLFVIWIGRQLFQTGSSVVTKRESATGSIEDLESATSTNSATSTATAENADNTASTDDAVNTENTE